MNTKEQVFKAVEEGQFVNKMQKNIATGEIKRAYAALEREKSIRDIINKNKSNRYSIIDIFPIGKDYAVVEIDDDFGSYRTVDLKTGYWHGKCSNSLDEQILITMELKHLGANSQFSEFACKMLNIEVK